MSREDPLEKEMATYSSTLAWEIPWTEEPRELRSMRSQKRRIGLSTHTRHRLSCSVVSNSATLWTVAPQTPLSVGFFSQEYWSRLPFPPRDLPNPGIEPASPVSLALAGGFFTTGKPFLLKVNKRQNYFSFGLFLLMFWTMFYFK